MQNFRFSFGKDVGQFFLTKLLWFWSSMPFSIHPKWMGFSSWKQVRCLKTEKLKVGSCPGIFIIREILLTWIYWTVSIRIRYEIDRWPFGFRPVPTRYSKVFRTIWSTLGLSSGWIKAFISSRDRFLNGIWKKQF